MLFVTHYGVCGIETSKRFGKGPTAEHSDSFNGKEILFELCSL